MAKLILKEMGHGGDYNPDQWRHIPGILEQDMALMKKSGVNLVSVGIFSWTALEPEEGRYDFGWLDEVLDKLHKNGVSAFLATPSGARPAWMDAKYPKVMRVDERGDRDFHGERHNHCFTSPKYRELVRKMNKALAERYGKHPAVAGWHISNEYSGECHCEACQSAFREFLKSRYESLDALNHAWWTGFWSKTYTDWSQLRSPSVYGETSINGLILDWRRFATAQTIDFMRAEIAPIRETCPDLPVTTNMHGLFPLDYYKFKNDVDFVSYDCYPTWGSAPDIENAMLASFNYDCMRSIKREPWILMESTPSMTNWQEICRPKRPGMHMLSSMQTVAHGADAVMYFQWRKGLGACEKLHGAVVGHDGSDNTRVFREVSAVGERLKKLSGIIGSKTNARAALVFDQENRWALNGAQGPRREKQYEKTVLEHYSALKSLNIDVDIIDEDSPLDGYKLVVAPMLYMVRGDFAKRTEAFVSGGGTFVTTYFSGIADEHDLCFRTGFPGPLRAVTGVYCEETDPYYPDQENAMVFEDGREAKCGFIADVLRIETAQAAAVYKSDFYAGRPALTHNAFGSGRAWYIASRLETAELKRFYDGVLKTAGIEPIIEGAGAGVTCASRGEYIFVMNFSGGPSYAKLPDCTGADDNIRRKGTVALDKNQALILRRL